VAVRIIPFPSMPNRLGLVLDKEKEGDQVVGIEDGRKVLLIGPDLAPGLEGMVLDYQETPYLMERKNGAKDLPKMRFNL
jgi:hypothetical protein